MCTPYKTYGVCPKGIRCNKNHVYKDEIINHKIGFNVIIGLIVDIGKNMETMNKKINKIEKSCENLEVMIKDFKDIQEDSGTIKIIYNKINTINNNLEKIKDACKSRGLPLSTTLTEFKGTFSNLDQKESGTKERSPRQRSSKTVSLNKRLIDESKKSESIIMKNSSSSSSIKSNDEPTHKITLNKQGGPLDIGKAYVPFPHDNQDGATSSEFIESPLPSDSLKTATESFDEETPSFTNKKGKIKEEDNIPPTRKIPSPIREKAFGILTKGKNYLFNSASRENLSAPLDSNNSIFTEEIDNTKVTEGKIDI
ncbi:MAG: hypothetical protein FSLLV1_gp4 [Hangzhou scotinophara lurida lispivirus 1]|uniref:C3H1-type domain-containing protein n=1 Tax=Hangzhou scotinophara lurida lispivirus 1 TaxID=2905569 RepID=A0A8K1XB65_9MONO|nr:MAG: hypothetical protein QKV01_gp4 [Hangzhou scotinophara lurida lispivirus 1]UHK03261.1 MAG: hypothetical protein FSLLV1_gp4 [Hangzhou scotinophara lurida lispivirus 1]